MSSLDNYMITSPSNFTLSDDYKYFIESMVDSIKTNGNYTTLAITPDTGYLYQGDMTAFLIDQGVPIEDHFVVVRLNDLDSVYDIDENLSTLMIPDATNLARLKQVFQTTL